MGGFILIGPLEHPRGYDITAPVAAKERVDGRDQWGTPDDVYQAICERWKVYPTLDVCASGDNTKCASYITAEVDAITCTWHDEPAWMNPPYSQPIMTKLIEHAILQAKNGGETLFLLPAWVDQKWYHDLIKPYEHDFWRGRIKHVPPPGVKPSSPRHGSIHGVIRQRKPVWNLSVSQQAWFDAKKHDLLVIEKFNQEYPTELPWEDLV